MASYEPYIPHSTQSLTLLRSNRQGNENKQGMSEANTAATSHA